MFNAQKNINHIAIDHPAPPINGTRPKIEVFAIPQRRPLVVSHSRVYRPETLFRPEISYRGGRAVLRYNPFLDINHFSEELTK